MALDDFTIYCTATQIKNALELGAPIDLCRYKITPQFLEIYDGEWASPITAEQMIGWLETQGIKISVRPFHLPAENWEDWDYWYCCKFETPEVYPCTTDFKTRPEATLAVITNALEYLKQHKHD